MSKEKTNLKLTVEMGALATREQNIDVRIKAKEDTALKQVDTDITGLKDASGTNLDFFAKDASLFFKVNDRWHFQGIACASAAIY